MKIDNIIYVSPFYFAIMDYGFVRFGSKFFRTCPPQSSNSRCCSTNRFQHIKRRTLIIQVTNRIEVHYLLVNFPCANNWKEMACFQQLENTLHCVRCQPVKVVYFSFVWIDSEQLWFKCFPIRHFRFYTTCSCNLLNWYNKNAERSYGIDFSLLLKRDSPIGFQITIFEQSLQNINDIKRIVFFIIV